MLKVRLIPSLLLSQGRCVKGSGFKDFKDVGNPVTAAKVYNAQGADELLFLDISATQENRPTLYDVVSRTADECFMPLTVGGGVRTLDDIRQLLNAGADKVAINTQGVMEPEFLREASQRFGAQCIVSSIDFRTSSDGAREVFTHSGTRSTGLDPVDWARSSVEFGAGEILLTSIEREGTRQGYDLELLRDVADAVSVPIIANGGAGTLQHLVEGIEDGHASAVSAGSIFHFTDQSVIKATSYMKNAGLDVRLG